MARGRVAPAASAMGRRRCLSFIFGLAAATVIPIRSSPADEPGLTAGGTAVVRHILDATTLELADGRVVRLVGIEVPSAEARRPALAAAARDAAALVEELAAAGATVELRFAGNDTDRHGRVTAHVFASDAWLQAALLRRGLARVQSFADNRLAVRDMLALEAAARDARIGLWADPAWRVIAPDEAGRHGGSFALVAGQPVDTAQVEGQAYVHFAADWRAALSLRIGPAALKLCRAAGLDPPALRGRPIRVRGFIDGTSQPLLEITHPEQIEVLATQRRENGPGVAAGAAEAKDR